MFIYNHGDMSLFHFTYTYTVCKLPLIQQVSLGTKNV